MFFIGILFFLWSHTTFIMKTKIAGKEKLPKLSAKLNQDVEIATDKRQDESSANKKEHHKLTWGSI